MPTVLVPLRWGDMDAYGHVNNVQIVRILEEARVAVFGPPPSAGEVQGPRGLVPLFDSLPPGAQALVAEHRVAYRAPLPYRDEPVRVEVRIGKVTPASFTIDYAVYDDAPGLLCVEASTVLAVVDGTSGALVRLNREQRALLETTAG